MSLSRALVQEALQTLPAMDPMLEAFYNKVELRESAVLLPLQERADDWHIVFTRRSRNLRNHKGEIAFPGGKVDEEDEDVIATAVREMEEEIGVPRGAVEVLGRLPESFSIAGFQISPIVGVIPHPVEFIPNPGELDEVFTVPVGDLLQPGLCKVLNRVRLGDHQHLLYSFPWRPGYDIWGATARMLKIFLEAMNGPLVLDPDSARAPALVEFPRPKYWIADDPFPGQDPA
jgi:8-oxo-dGTP pyrophosphatase MutT (NUDIX family)